MRSIIFAALFILAGSWTPAAGISVAVEVEVRLAEGLVLPGDARLQARSLEGTDITSELGPPRSGTYLLPMKGTWNLELHGSGVWAAATEFTAPGKAIIAIEPGSTLSASLKAPPKQRLPREASLRLTPCRRERALAEQVCAVQKGRVECRVPLGCFDGRLRLRGFASHYFWETKVGRNPPTNDLGAIALKPGASVSGWITTEDGRPFDDSLRVTLAPQGLRTDGSPITARLARTTLETVPDRRGFFQVSEVNPGNYELAASLRGYSPVTEPLVYVREGLETALPHPMVLARPRHATFQVTPPLAPSGEPWTLQLAHHPPSGVRLVDQKPLDETGFADFADLVPGKYGITLLTGPAGPPFLERQIEVTALEEMFTIDLELVEIRGTVTLAGAPLAGAELVFGGRTGAQSVALETDDEGRFHGALPRAGRWKVEIGSEAEGVQRSLAAVEVRRPKGKSVATITIDLTDARIAGVVVDEDFVPQERALVEVLPDGVAESAVAIRTEPDGTFELRGLPEGPATIRAQAQDAESAPQLIQLTEESRDRLQVVVRKTRKIRGTVLDRIGPVAAANAYFRELGGVMQRGAGAVTEFDGSFEITLPRDVTAVHARVGAPGRTLYVGRRDLGDSVLTIPLPLEGGTLELLYPPDLWEWVFFVHEGASAWYGPFQAWAALQEAAGGRRDFAGGRLVIPQLAPGPWEVCLVEPGSAAWLTVAILGQGVTSNCARFHSVPGSTAAADLRSIPASRRANE